MPIPDLQAFLQVVKEWRGSFSIDAANAFNSVNRGGMVLNSRHLWARASTFIFNCYQGAAPLVLQSGEHLLSREGTTQGDPLAMFLYGMATLPLLRMSRIAANSVSHNPSEHLRDGAFADDWNGSSPSCDTLLAWIDAVCKKGPDFGVNVNIQKTNCIASPERFEEATRAFGDKGISVSKGSVVLGGWIGDPTAGAAWRKQKIDAWVKRVGDLAAVARDWDPQGALYITSRALVSEWEYFLKVNEVPPDELHALDDALRNLFRALSGHPNLMLSDLEWDFIFSPERDGGIGLLLPSKVASSLFQRSLDGSSHLRASLNGEVEFNGVSHRAAKRSAASDFQHRASLIQESLDQRIASALVADNPTGDTMRLQTLRNAQRLRQVTPPRWLSVSPIPRRGFRLSAQSFRDALAGRFGLELLPLREKCTCAGAPPFTRAHAMSCNKAGYLTARHNEVRNLIGALAKEVTSEVANDPVIRKGVAATDDRSAIPELKADLLIQGFWENDSEKVVCIDFCVHDTDAASSSREVRSALSRKEAGKRLKYFLECSKRVFLSAPLRWQLQKGPLVLRL